MKFLDLNGLSQLVTFGNNSYVSSVIYDSTNHVINFKNANGSVISSIDASNFIKDGMVSSVTIDTPETGPNVGKSCLIVTFNTDSGKDPIEIPIENIFSSENYYTKTEIDNQLDDKQDTLVSGTNIKTINNQSIVGSGNINITADGCEVVSNKVTSLSSSSTDTQYPSAKAVYDELSAKVSLSDYESDEEVVAESLNDLNARITSVESNKQDTISDIETIRSNAAAGAAKVSNVQSDWNAASGDAQILNKPNLATVATSGDYGDLSNKPTIGNGMLMIQQNGSDVESFSANQTGTVYANITVPTDETVSEWGFTKNTGTYSKPSGGIPKTDLASTVQTSLDKADTALQSYTETDPVFSASAAAGISSIDISNWNNKVSNVQADWNATSGLAQILNKPTIPSTLDQIADGSTRKLSDYLPLSGGAMLPSAEVSFGMPNYGYTKVSYGGISVYNGGYFDGIKVEVKDPNADGGVGGIYVTDENLHGYFKSYDYTFPKKTGTVALTSDVPAAVTESTVSGWGFTKNAVTQVKVGTTAYNPSSGVVSLPAYPTSLPASDVSSWAKASSKPTYTASEVGAIATSAIGAANGVAPLNTSSKIDATYLPSYVDDVLEYSGISNFPSTGEAGKIYTDTSTNKIYRWSGSQYIEISPSAGVTVTNGTSALSWDTDVTVGTVNGVNITAKLPSNPNTWRGIQDNLTSSTNTTESLSAKQGYLLANGSARDNTKLPLTGGTITGTTTLTYGTNLDFVDSNGKNHSLRAIASWPDSLAHYVPGNGWVRMWDSGNDGSGSGLDADLLDGLHAADFKKQISGNKRVYASGWYRILNCKAYPASFLITFSGGYYNYPPTPVTFLISHSYNVTSITQMGRCPYIGAIKKIRVVHHDTTMFYIDVKFEVGQDQVNPISFTVTPLDNCYDELELIDFTLQSDGGESAIDTVRSISVADALNVPRSIWGQSFDGSADVSGDMTGVGEISMSRGIVSGGTSEGVFFGHAASGLGPNYKGGLVYAYGGYPLFIHTNGGNRMTITGAGKVGIGTDTPTYKLDVAGDIHSTNEMYVGSTRLAKITEIPTSLPASDVYSWAKASSKPSYSWSEITDKPSVAIQGEPNNFMHSTNEFTFIPPNYNNTIWFNYRTSDYTTSGNVTGYYFGDGNGHALAYIADGDMYVNSTRLAKITEIPTNTNQLTNGAGFITGITKSMVTTALGYTPPTSDTNTTYAAGTGVTISGGNNAINVTYGTAANTACQGNDSRLSNARPASDVYAWAKASSKPSYQMSEISMTESYMTISSNTTIAPSYGNIMTYIITSNCTISPDEPCHFFISTFNTAPTISWANNVNFYGGTPPVIEANKLYEVDMLHEVETDKYQTIVVEVA